MRRWEAYVPLGSCFPPLAYRLARPHLPVARRGRHPGDRVRVTYPCRRGTVWLCACGKRCVRASREPGMSGDDGCLAVERHGAPSVNPFGSGLGTGDAL